MLKHSIPASKLEAFLCLLGFHKWRYRNRGKYIERVCMRENCDCIERARRFPSARH